MTTHNFATWRDILYDEYKWIADVESNEPLVNIVRDIINDDDDDDMNVYKSSIWAVGMAYLDYKEKTQNLTRDEHKYARSRGGVLGMTFEQPFQSVTLREYLYLRDPGFELFSTPRRLQGPKAG